MTMTEYLNSHRKKMGRKLLIKVKDFGVPLAPLVVGNIRQVEIVGISKEYVGIKTNNQAGVCWYTKEYFTKNFELAEVL